MIKVVVPNDKKKIQQQIQALEYLITVDTIEKDKKIHQYELQNLKDTLN